MNENQNTKTELPKVSATIVSKYLLFLDPRREYFSKIHLLIIDSKDNYRSKPTIGNFRLNKMLQIIQALYYACYKQLLFEDEMVAFENGGVVREIFSSFMRLHREIDYIPPPLIEEQREFIRKVFFYLRDNYSDRELRELAHEDLAWMKAWGRKRQGGSDKFIYDEEVLNYYEKLSSSMLRAMKINVDR